MAWNFLQIVEFGATSDDLYPLADGRGIGFVLTAEDTNPVTYDINGLKVVRQTGDGPWLPSLNVLRTRGKLLVSDRRIAVTFGKFVPKDQSSFDPVLFAHPNGSTAKRGKEMLVGHLLMTQLRRIGVRGGRPSSGRAKSSRAKGDGDGGLGSLIVTTTDETDDSDQTGQAGEGGWGDHVAIEFILAGAADPVAIGNDVLSRSVLAKVSSPLLTIEQTVRLEWAEVIRRGFSPAPGDMEHYVLSPFQPVAVIRPTEVSASLIPPTDTAPVPTMLPTPAFPMPTVGLAPPQPSTAAELPDPLVPVPPAPGSTAEWRADPFGRFELRYWDGFGWTEHVHGDGGQDTDPPH